ncbi:MAG: low molecular weight phosphatase family protein [Halodesulfurarchaeum sp.]
MAADDTIRVEFVCPKNAGRSQMAAGFARRERRERNLEDVVEINSAGTSPADSVHDVVVEAMAEVDIDVSDRTPTYVVLDDLEESHFVITMGCQVPEFNPEHYGVESRVWDLPNPEGEDIETVRPIRDEIERRVESVFDEIEAIAEERSTEVSLSKRVLNAITSALGSNGP